LGCRFDGWSDRFRYDLWEKAFEKAWLEMTFYTRKKNFGETLPWSFIETGVGSDFLWKEYQRSLREEITPSCSVGDCHRCSLCDGKEIAVREGRPLQKDAPPKKERSEIRKKGLRMKFRLTFVKKGEFRFISHLELAHLFYRSAKRAGLSLHHSEGFHPMPKIVFEKALPVGVESLREIVDIELEGRIASDELRDRLNRSLPDGIEIIEAREVLLPFRSSSPPDRSVYRIYLDHLLSKEESQSRLKKALEKGELFILQERKEKKRKIDLLPLIEKAEIYPVRNSSHFDSKPSEVSNSTAISNGVKEEIGESGDIVGLGLELVLRSHGGKTAKPLEALETLLELGREALAQCRIVKIE